MPTEVYEEAIELELDLLEAVLAWNPDEPGAAGYPLPPLRLTGRRAVREFQTLCLENEWIKAAIAPALGGRIVRLLDKRRGVELIDSAPKAVSGGKRGVRLPFGIEVWLASEERLDAMAPVVCDVEEAGDDIAPAIWVAGVEPGSGLSFHGRFTAPNDCARVDLEVRVFNRTQRAALYHPMLVAHHRTGATTCLGAAAWIGDATGGVALVADGPGLRPVDGEGYAGMARFGSARLLGPRQSDRWQAFVLPLRGGEPVACNGEAAVWLSEEEVSIQVVKDRANHKIIVQTWGGRTLESMADLEVARDLSFGRESLPSPASELVVLDPGRREVIRAPELPATISRPEIALEPAVVPDDAGEQELYDWAFAPGARSQAHTLLAIRRLEEGLYAEASTEFESALLFDAEDPLAWWGKAVADRLAGVGDAEAPELLNAHFLAPLEPMLRAEGFLAQSNFGKEPSPLLAQMAEMPDLFVECAGILVEHGLPDQASRWIDESLRHVDLPMLRYLLAYCYLTGSRMKAEAAEQVAAAERTPFAPPFPWRPIEIKALRAVVAAFPHAERPIRFLAAAEAAGKG